MKSKQHSNVLLRFLVMLTSVVAIYCDCNPIEFECDNGSCISQFDACNGVANCPDGSDELAATCVSQRQYCSTAFFQCSYGACVNGNARCNGLQECADGSDETLLRCGGDDEIREFEKNAQGNCQDGEIKCPSGICIDKSTKVCNGENDCGDDSGYDESVKFCGHIECPGYSFKCGSGGCIPGTQKCDGNADCFDKSDEAPLLCNKTRSPSTTAVTASIDVRVTSGGCQLPSPHERPILKNKAGNILKPPIKQGRVYFSCNRGFILLGHNMSYCSNNKWSVPVVPKCIKYCASEGELSGYSTAANCVLDGQNVDCRQPYHAPGTIVKFNCANGFVTQKIKLPDMTCMPGGFWKGTRERCYQLCGEIAVPIQIFAADGIPVQNEVVPWHTGIYAIHNEINYSYKCGGTLLTPDLVITAAHCVFSEASKQLYSSETFQVIASKLYREYNHTTKEDRMRRVHKIISHSEYKGEDTGYLNDVAIMVLENPLEFNSFIRPICVRFATYANKETITNNVAGKFAGWNIAGKHELQLVSAKSTMNSECRIRYQSDINPDKFCITTTGNSRACRGDSGGGFTHEHEVQDSLWRKVKRHYLYGIISNAPTADLCANGVTVLTNIQHFEDFITDAINDSVDNRS